MKQFFTITSMVLAILFGNSTLAQPDHNTLMAGDFEADQVFDDSQRRQLPSAVLVWKNNLKRTAEGIYSISSKTPISFTSMAVLWETNHDHAEPDDFIIKYRLREEDGQWTDLYYTEGAYHPSIVPRGLYVSELIMLSDTRLFNEFEVFINPPAGVSITKIETDVSLITAFSSFPKGELPVEHVAATTRSGIPFPPVVRRTSWCTTAACLNPTYQVNYIDATHSLIHYGAVPNDYTDGAAVVMSYWNHHVNTNGWFDIGYNYLLDKHGNLFEGRHNPQLPEQDVRAAHAGPPNAVSIGINFLGNTDAPALHPTGIQLERNIQLLTWWYDHKDLDPTTAEEIILQDPAGETGVRYRISGHRDVGSTHCPGNLLHGNLPEMRLQVLERLNTTIFSIGENNVEGEADNFPTLREAVTYLNTLSEFTGNKILYITSDLEEDCSVSGIGLAADPGEHTITFKPAPETTPTITLHYPADVNAGPSGAFIIGITHENNIAWADARPTRNIIFDGSNVFNGTTRDLTITNTTTTHRNGMPFLLVGDVANVTVKNLNVYHQATLAATDGNVGFNGAIAFRVNHNATENNAPHNIEIDNCHLSVDFPEVTAGYNGINVFKTGSGANGYISNISITNNLIEGKANGIFLAWAGDSIHISGNEIRVNQDIGAAVTANAGVQLPLTLAGSNIEIRGNYFNKVANLGTNAAANTAAIDITAGGNYIIANNMIRGFEITGESGFEGAIRGIRISNASADVVLAYNTLMLNELENITESVALTYKGIHIVSGDVQMKNNIVTGKEDDFAMTLLDFSVLPGEMDHNLYYLSATENALLGTYNANEFTTLQAWQTATGLDALSVFADPLFLAEDDLRIDDLSPAKWVALPMANITDDFFGTPRHPEMPCIGAHENQAILFAGTYSVGAESVEGEVGNYPTFREAVTALNTQASFTSNVTLYITSDLTEDCTVSGIGLAVDPSPYTITIKPAPGKTPTITFHYPADINQGPSGAFIIGISHENNLAWADAAPTRNIIIDGSNTDGGTSRDLTFTNTTNTHRNGMPFLMIGDVSNISIHNVNIYHRAAHESSPTQVGFNGALAMRVNHNLVENNAPRNISVANSHISADFAGVSPGYNGVNIFRSNAGSEGYVHNISLVNNLIEGKANGLFLPWLGENLLIYGNEIRANQDAGTGILANSGIQLPLTAPGSNVMIAANNFSKVSNIGTSADVGMTAIDIVAPGNYIVANNMITGFEVSATAGHNGALRGVRINNANANVLMAYNSVYLNELPNVSGTTSLSYRGLELASGNVALRNNIFATSEDDFVFHLLQFNALPGVATNNLYHLAATENASLVLHNNIAFGDLAEWQTSSGLEENSLHADPMFVSATDLSIMNNSPAQFAGIPVEDIETDFFGNPRDEVQPSIGAHENQFVTPTFTVTFTVTDPNGQAITDATITLGEVENAPGNYVFEGIENGSYNYSLTAEGHHPASGSLIVEDADVVQNVIMEIIETDAIIVSADNPDDITVPFGTPAEELPLPASLQINLDTEETVLLFVSWDLTGYNGQLAGTYIIEGELLLMDGIVNPNNIKAAISVIVEEEDDVFVGDLNKGDFVIYPNPASTQVMIRNNASAIESISVTDINGRIVYAERNIENNEYTIDLSSFNNGLYFIRIYIGNKVLIKKLQVQK